MTTHVSKQQKSEIALLKAKFVLLQRGWMVFESYVDYWQPFDLLVIHPAEPDKILKIQVKYASNGQVRDGSTVSNRTGNTKKKYDNSDFDFYALYLPDVDTVVFPAISFKGITIATTHRNCAAGYYWYEDFLELTTAADKRTRREQGLTPPTWNREKRSVRFKVPLDQRPSPDEFQKMLLEYPITQIGEKYGVSGNAIRRWIRQSEVELVVPEHGHWQREHMKKKRAAGGDEN